MKRDLDLLRTILLRVEETKPGTNLLELGLKADFADLANHVELLVEAGLLKAQVAYLDHSVQPVYVVVERLTWSGHEVVDLARQEARWQQVVARVAAATGTTSFDIVRRLLEDAHHRALGLPVN